MPGRKSNGTETRTDPRPIFGRAEFSVRHPLPGSPGGGFFADRGLRRMDQGRGSAAQPTPGLTPTKTGSHSQRCNSLFVLEPISGLEPETY